MYIPSVQRPETHRSDRQLGIPPPQPHLISHKPDIRPHDGQVPRERHDGAEEVAEQHCDAVELDAEADQGPAEEDEGQAAEEGGGAAGFLLAGEEEESLLRADYYC